MALSNISFNHSAPQKPSSPTPPRFQLPTVENPTPPAKTLTFNKNTDTPTPSFITPEQTTQTDNGYKGTWITSQKLVEDTGHIRDHSHYTFDISTAVKKIITTKDRKLAEDIAKHRNRQTKEAQFVRDRVQHHVKQYLTGSNIPSGVTDRQLMTELVVNDVCGYGPIQGAYEDTTLSEIMVTTPFEAFVEYQGSRVPCPGIRFSSREHAIEVISQICQSVNVQFDETHAIADFRLSDLSRVNAKHPAIAVLGPTLSIRKHLRNNFSLMDLRATGAMNDGMFQTLGQVIENGASMAFIGGTSSGKTTLLSACMALIPPQKRIISAEDTLEIECDNPHIETLSTRAGNNPVTLDDLIISMLRSAPDYVLCGEVRTSEALKACCSAAATGHVAWTSFHSGNLKDFTSRCIQLITSGSPMSEKAAVMTVASAFDILVFQKRFPQTGERKIVSIYEVTGDVVEGAAGTPQLGVNTLWSYKAHGVDTSGNKPKMIGEFVQENELSDEKKEKLLILDSVPRPIREYENLITTRSTETSYERFNRESGGTWN